MPSLSVWERTRFGGKAGFDKLWGWADKMGAPANKLSNKLGSEAFWPTTLDKESDKAARILRSFCKDGFYDEEVYQTADGPARKQKVLKTIPPEVIRKAKGLAIFTTMRTGLWVSGAGGSGVLVGRTGDGSWSSPSGILLHTAGLGFLVGVDIYDCVVVINTQQALDAFSSPRITLGGEISAVVGPAGVGGVLETEVHKRQAPVFTYLKSRGFYAGVQIDGTVMIERTDENERFYGQRIPVADILAGRVRHQPHEVKTLMETIKAAQGDRDVDQSLLPSEPSPADYEIDGSNGRMFGIPDKDDPDPYGVLALEREGLEIREAGTHIRPPSGAFEFKPSANSPVFTALNRRSVDSRSLSSISRRSSWRTSQASTVLERRLTLMADTSTQTDLEPAGVSLSAPVSAPRTPPRSPKRNTYMNGHSYSDSTTPTRATLRPASTSALLQPRSPTRTAAAARASPSATANGAATTPAHPADADTDTDTDADADADAPDDPSDAEEHDAVTVHEVHQAAAPQVISRARLVTVPRRLPPKLPPRNPIRDRRKPLVIGAAAGGGARDAGTGMGGSSPASEAGASAGSPGRSPGSWAGERREGELAEADDAEDVEGQMERRMGGILDGDEFHSLPGTPRASRTPSPAKAAAEREGYF